MKIGDRIAKEMAEKGWTEGELSRRSGVTQPTIHRIITGESASPRQGNVESIAKALGVSTAYLWKGEITSLDANVEPAPADRGKVPLISFVQAGLWCEAIEPYSFANAEEYLPCPVPHSDLTYALTVRGESMYNPHGPRSFRPGDIIYVDPMREPENGSLVIAKLVDDQESTFKQLIIEGRSRYLKALNPSWPEPFIAINEEVVICGVVISKLEVF